MALVWPAHEAAEPPGGEGDGGEGDGGDGEGGCGEGGYGGDSERAGDVGDWLSAEYAWLRATA